MHGIVFSKNNIGMDGSQYIRIFQIRYKAAVNSYSVPIARGCFLRYFLFYFFTTDGTTIGYFKGLSKKV